MVRRRELTLTLIPSIYEATLEVFPHEIDPDAVSQ